MTFDGLKMCSVLPMCTRAFLLLLLQDLFSWTDDITSVQSTNEAISNDTTTDGGTDDITSVQSTNDAVSNGKTTYGGTDDITSVQSTNDAVSNDTTTERVTVDITSVQSTSVGISRDISTEQATDDATAVQSTTDAWNSDTTTMTTKGACYDYLGMQNNDIPDRNIIASAEKMGLPASNARLDGLETWSADGGYEETWIQADIGYQTFVSGVVTQGDGGGHIDGWVTIFKVSTFLNSTGDREDFIKCNQDDIKVFDGNTDIDTKVASYFPEPVYARIVRITCLARNEEGHNWNIRFELLGCKIN